MNFIQKSLKMRLTEIFKTIQCEGTLTGMVSVIVRLGGCNLQCKWCDERFSSRAKGGLEISINELLKKINKYNCKNIIITGGEPLIYKEIIELSNRLKDADYHVTIETNATIQKRINCDLISMSPKLSHSIPNNIPSEGYERKRINIEAIRYYIRNYDYQIKFVVGLEEDFNEIEAILLKIGDYDRSKILIMPLASSRRQLFAIQKNIVKLCVERNYRYGNRLQLQIWGKGKETKKW